eukprot:scaffold2189_cov161-Isochrysis_galbana.AAC.1
MATALALCVALGVCDVDHCQSVLVKVCLSRLMNATCCGGGLSLSRAMHVHPLTSVPVRGARQVSLVLTSNSFGVSRRSRQSPAVRSFCRAYRRLRTGTGNLSCSRSCSRLWSSPLVTLSHVVATEEEAVCDIVVRLANGRWCSSSFRLLLPHPPKCTTATARYGKH